VKAVVVVVVVASLIVGKLLQKIHYWTLLLQNVVEVLTVVQLQLQLQQLWYHFHRLLVQLYIRRQALWAFVFSVAAAVAVRRRPSIGYQM
jgi:hypothetical protein